MSIPSSNDEQRGHRPTLPPIRDLFREELSHPAVYVHDSPPLTLERLCVRDDVDYNNLPASQDSLPRELPVPQQPTYRETPYRDAPVPYYHSHWTPRYIEQSQMRLPLSLDSLGGYDGAQAPQEYSYFPLSPLHQSHSQDRARPELSSRDEHITVPPRQPNYILPSASRPPGFIATSLAPYYSLEDEARTPIARYRDGPTSYLPNSNNAAFPAEDTSSASNVSKYECKYCGKGFNRPSSLKIHTNSHTGEKPFVCPIEACGRSFSVLSNMRRHARVHQVPIKDISGDEGWNITAPDSPDLLHDSGGIAIHSRMDTSTASRWHHRRDSSASTSSGTSRRSQGTLSDDEDDDADNRAEK